MFAIFALCFPCALPARESAAFPTPESLVDGAVAAAKAQAERNWQYTYREDHTQSQAGKDGKPGPSVTRIYDHIMLEGSDYRKLVLIDGKPLDAKTQKKVDADLEKARAERRRSLLPPAHFSESLDTLELLPRLFDNKVTGREIVNGRAAWKMESTPKPDARPANTQEEEVLASRRTNWFDEQDGYAFHEIIEYMRPINHFEPGTVFDFQMTRVGDDWLWSDQTIHALLKWTIIRARSESHQHYYDYKRFQTDSTFTPQ
ncbi:MAG TPA: hypothetical protein VHA14_07025 [Bryobacteraceae bacterium]|nr:hypothetical protein [Bryobacteraceae bacterium]